MKLDVVYRPGQPIKEDRKSQAELDLEHMRDLARKRSAAYRERVRKKLERLKEIDG